MSINSVFASYLWDIDFGIQEYYKGNFNYSKNYFTTYLKSNPNDEEGYWWLAKTYQKLKNHDLALKCFEKSYSITSSKKELEELNFNIKETSLLKDYFDMAVQYYDNGNYKEADFYADIMLKLDKQSAGAYFIKAKIAKTINRDKEAREYLEQAIICDNDILKTNLAKALNIAVIPKMTKEIYRYNALQSYYMGDVKEAVDNSKKYLELNKNADMENFLASLFIKTKNTVSAKKIIENIKASNTANIQTYILEAKLTTNEDKKEKILHEAYKINPNNQDILLESGNLYLRKKDYKNSLKYFEFLNFVNSKLYEGYFGLVYSMLKLNKTEDTLDFIRKMDEINPSSSETQFLLSLVAQNQMSYVDALDYLDEALKKDENASYYLEKAKIYYFLKDYEKSLENLKLVSKTKNSTIDKKEINDYFIKNYLKLNMPKNAQNLLEYSTNIDKNRIMYKYYLYNLCKLENNNYKSCTKKYKYKKPSLLMDYVDISEILFEENDFKNMAKIIKLGFKKYPYSSELFYQKNKLEYYSENR